MKIDKLKIFTADIGNTRTHCASVIIDGDENLVDSYNVVDSKDFPSSDFAGVFGVEFTKSGSCAAVWCSVVPKYADVLQKAITEAKVKSMRLCRSNFPLGFDMKNPDEVGQDRMADALGAGLFFKPPYIIIDTGTATTVDLVDACGRYAGGVITPGLHAFSDYLGERAALLPRIDPSEKMEVGSVGKNTKEAMYVGCARGFCNMIDSFVEDIGREYFIGVNPWKKTVLTGGSLTLLPEGWLAKGLVERNLSALGLARAFAKKML